MEKKSAKFQKDQVGKQEIKKEIVYSINGLRHGVAWFPKI
jgi:hypothetical protein